MDGVPSLNLGRTVLVRALATAVAIVGIVFALTALFGSPSLVPAVISEGKILGLIFSSLPRTLELVAASFIIASLVGLALTRLPAHSFRTVVSGIMTCLQSVPIFLVAIVAQIVLGVRFGWPTAGTCSNPCTLGEQLFHLALPAATLAVYQLPAVVAFFESQEVAGIRVKPASTMRDLAVLFAERLPDVVSAAIIVEAIYVWSGEGRLFFDMHVAYDADKGAFVAYLVLNALLLLLIRALAAVVQRRDGAETDD